jgi:hypothetical protein
MIEMNNIMMKSNMINIRRLSSNVKFKEVINVSLAAEKLADSCKPITAKDINKFLCFAGIRITQAKLELMLKIPRLEFNNLNRDTIKSKYYIENIGTYRGKIQIPGVYI